MRNFHLAYPELPGPPRKLLDWIEAWEQGLEDYSRLDDNEPINKRLRAGFFQRGG